MQCYSRLADARIWRPDSSGAMPEISEVAHIPGNWKLARADRLRRFHWIHRPFCPASPNSSTASRRKASDPGW
jgi:predicted N-formylglutamate amidohydrolase